MVNDLKGEYAAHCAEVLVTLVEKEPEVALAFELLDKEEAIGVASLHYERSLERFLLLRGPEQLQKLYEEAEVVVSQLLCDRLLSSSATVDEVCPCWAHPAIETKRWMHERVEALATGFRLQLEAIYLT